MAVCCAVARAGGPTFFITNNMANVSPCRLQLPLGVPVASDGTTPICLDAHASGRIMCQLFIADRDGTAGSRASGANSAPAGDGACAWDDAPGSVGRRSTDFFRAPLPMRSSGAALAGELPLRLARQYPSHSFRASESIIGRELCHSGAESSANLAGSKGC